ncbi:BTAD domain-containing putative transcriptional regulator [Actinoplanes sp. CA-252034]|uniref:BTAD domain-containing putative transcriptional regulator n=1 Tax=Actinoplanes sp. CA-252034 TaxID=3239906 RepID=UPI003D994881
MSENAVLRYADAGEWERAVAEAQRAVATGEPLDAGDAWPAVMALYLRGDLAGASAVPLKVSPGGAPTDRALLAAWSASVAWARGEVAACRELADEALAGATGEPRALAAAHTALALLAAAEGDRRGNERHYALGLAAAERCEDRTQQLRIRTNRASQRMEEGDLTGALAELDHVLWRFGIGPDAHPNGLGLVHNNRAEILVRAGRLAEARDGFRAALTVLQRAGAAGVAYALAGLGETHEARGDLVQARAAFEEAVTVAAERGFSQALVPALCGLARVLAAEGDVAAARIAGRRAVAEATSLTAPSAYAAAGWAALPEDPSAARRHAESAIDLARAGRRPAALAEGLELAAAAVLAPAPAAAPETGRQEAGRFLSEAARIWADVGDQVAAARVDLALARIGAGRAPIAARVVVEHRLRALGADPSSGTRSLARPPARPPTTVRMLGSFAVLHGDDPVPVAAWQSRKARDLLKLLIARRGRPITRDALGEALWPGEPNVANRLSITLSVLRGVLDPDRRLPADHYVTAGTGGLAYDGHTLAVDVDAFLQLAYAGTAAAREGRPEEARVLLSAADTAYTGEVLADEPDFEDAGPLRAEARLAHLAVMRALGGVHVAAGDLDSAAWAWSRLLADDPYDGEVALRLVTELSAAGRHGEAARQRHRYEVRMRELGIPTHSEPKGRSR